MNKRYLAIIIAATYMMTMLADEEITKRIIKTKSPSRLKKVNEKIKKFDLVSTATTDQLKKSVSSKKSSHSKRWSIDKIIRRVNGTNILASDLNRPRISKEGGNYTLDELTKEELLVQKSAELHMLPSITDINRQLVAFKIQNNLTGMGDDEFEKELQSSGFSLIEYKSQLGRLMATENVRRVELSERLVITTQEIEKFYNENPEYIKEAYHLNICTIPAKNIDNAQEFVKTTNVLWSDLGMMEKDEIGEQFSFVTTLNPGEYSKVFKMDGQHKIIKLISKQEKRIKTLDERYKEIERKIQDNKRERFIDRLEIDLIKNALIVDLK